MIDFQTALDMLPDHDAIAAMWHSHDEVWIVSWLRREMVIGMLRKYPILPAEPDKARPDYDLVIQTEERDIYIHACERNRRIRKLNSLALDPQELETWKDAARHKSCFHLVRSGSQIHEQQEDGQYLLHAEFSHSHNAKFYMAAHSAMSALLAEIERLQELLSQKTDNNG